MSHTSIPAPLEVLFSRRAVAAICAETLEHHPLETGGILLGHWHQRRWQVLEAIDPGPGARCTPTTFEYDRAYVAHLASKLARQYRKPLELIGLWHRHPGSFDRFSAEDDVTNQRFVALTPHGALSCLVNLDPDFRLTAFHVPKDLRYRRLPLVVGDALIDSQLREPLHPGIWSRKSWRSRPWRRNCSSCWRVCLAFAPHCCLRWLMALSLCSLRWTHRTAGVTACAPVAGCSRWRCWRCGVRAVSFGS